MKGRGSGHAVEGRGDSKVMNWKGTPFSNKERLDILCLNRHFKKKNLEVAKSIEQVTK